MMLAAIILGARSWVIAAAVLGIASLLVVATAYSQAWSSRAVRITCGTLKFLGLALLAICLVDPLYTGTRPIPGHNLFLVLADDSRSLQLTDPGRSTTRGAIVRERLAADSSWFARLGQDFDVRSYAFDSQLKPVQEYDELSFEGEASSLAGSLKSLAERYRDRPVAGILLFTDGNATDVADANLDWKRLPPIYPVTTASSDAALDLAVTHTAVSQTNFEAAPVTLTASMEARAIGDRKSVLRVLDEAGKEVERRTLTAGDAKETNQRFLIKPEKSGVAFYQIQASLEGEESSKAASAEATTANNRRWAVVDRGGGPYRVLYVSGSPNWEFKFLRRALAKDDEVHLVGLVRVAKTEPKFSFLNRSGDRTNPLFRGFENAEEQAEQHDEPVLLRLGTEDEEELRGGFPKAAEDLFRYHAVILDDVEAAFFTQDQLSLLQQFVGRRGGGLMMTGGKGSFAEGGYARSPLGEMLPVYLDQSAGTTPGGYRLKLTREGLLQPWVRLRSTEDEESTRLAAMPPFLSLNRIDSIKPGGSVLAEAEIADGVVQPALAVQPFGRGRTAALMVGDMWRWDLRRPDPAQSDLETTWRQTVRWLTADVPQAVEAETIATAGSGGSSVEIVVRARDKKFDPLDNAKVKLTVVTPDKREIEIDAESDERRAGEYRARFTSRVAGPYRATASVAADDGSEVGTREIGWAFEPETEEFHTLTGNRDLLGRIAAETGGEVLEMSGLESFVAGLPNRKIPIVETWTYPLWHQGSILTTAILCLVGEWGLRRWKGLP